MGRSTCCITRLGWCGSSRMALDPRNVKPADLCRLLNSTPLGAVINERQLYRHRTASSFKIGGPKTVDLFRYVPWLILKRHKPANEAADYAALREGARARNAALSAEGRE